MSDQTSSNDQHLNKYKDSLGDWNDGQVALTKYSQRSQTL